MKKDIGIWDDEVTGWGETVVCASRAGETTGNVIAQVPLTNDCKKEMRVESIEQVEDVPLRTLPLAVFLKKVVGITIMDRQQRRIGSKVRGSLAVDRGGRVRRVPGSIERGVRLGREQ